VGREKGKATIGEQDAKDDKACGKPVISKEVFENFHV
jgi:hypothetical protein